MALSMIAPGCKPGDGHQNTIPTQIPTVPSISAPPHLEDTNVLYRNIDTPAISGEYSLFILDNNLVPRELSGTPEARIKMAIDYLKRFYNALKSEGAERGPTFTSLNINTKENFPIAIPEDWNMWHFVNSFLEEIDGKIEDRQIKIEYQKLSVPGTRNRFKSSEKGFTRETRIRVDDKLLEKDYSKVIRNFTDAELAKWFVSTYSQVLQEQEMVRLNILPAIPSNGDLIKEKEEFANGTPRETIIRRGVSFELAIKINCAEAQRDAVELMFPYVFTLLNVNGTASFPGLAPGENQYGLFKLFKEAVVENQDALFPKWQIRHYNNQF